MAYKSNKEPSYELSQEDGPSVIALSVCSGIAEIKSIAERRKSKEENEENEIKYLNLRENRHQRLILYNMIAYIWSLLYLIYYLECVHKVYDDNMNTDLMNQLYLSYFVMIFCASSLIIIIECVELKEWIDKKNKKALDFMAFIRNFVGLIYISSFFLHIGITWKQSNTICRNEEDEWYCKCTFISSGFLSIYISWILCLDSVYTVTRNTGSRIQYLVFFIAILMYIICLMHYRNEWKLDKEHDNLLIVGEIGWWLLLFSYAFALVLDCFTFMNNDIVRCIISFSMIIGAILSVNREVFIFNETKFVYEAWFLLFTFTLFLSYQLHTKKIPRRRRVIGEPRPKSESIASMASFYKQYGTEGSQDVNPMVVKIPSAKKKKKKHSFNLDHKTQRLIVYNLLLFIWSIQMFVTFGDRLMDEQRLYYQMEITAASMMSVLTLFVIFMEWKNPNDQNETKVYKYGCAFAYFLCSLFQIIGLIDELFSNRCDTDFCKVGLVGSSFLGIVVPVTLSFDIVWNEVMNNIRWRVMIQSFWIGISCFLYYIGYRAKKRSIYNGSRGPWYVALSEFGWLLSSVLFLVFCATLFFRDQCSFRSPKYDGMILFLIGVLYCLSLGFLLSYPYGMYPIDNVSTYDSEVYMDTLLLIPICILSSYEMNFIS